MPASPISSSNSSAPCAGCPLGDPGLRCPAEMVNLIGDDIKTWAEYLALPNAKLHLYGEAEARPGRKMGHVTLLK